MRPSNCYRQHSRGRSVTAATPSAARLGNTGNTCTRAYRKRALERLRIFIAGNSHQRDHCYHRSAGWQP